jgi:hypothetical protein
VFPTGFGRHHIHNGEVLVVTDNDPGAEEVKLARLAFPVGKMRYSSLSTGRRVESRFAKTL